MEYERQVWPIGVYSDDRSVRQFLYREAWKLQSQRWNMDGAQWIDTVVLSVSVSGVDIPRDQWGDRKVVKGNVVVVILRAPEHSAM